MFCIHTPCSDILTLLAIEIIVLKTPDDESEVGITWTVQEITALKAKVSDYERKEREVSETGK